jgi:hypothetical protein
VGASANLTDGVDPDRERPCFEFFLDLDGLLDSILFLGVNEHFIMVREDMVEATEDDDRASPRWCRGDWTNIICFSGYPGVEDVGALASPLDRERGSMFD